MKTSYFILAACALLGALTGCQARQMGLGSHRFGEPDAKPNFWKEWHRQLQADTHQVMHTVEDPRAQMQDPDVTPVDDTMVQPEVRSNAAAALPRLQRPSDVPTLPEPRTGDVQIDRPWLKILTDDATGATSIRVGSQLFPVFQLDMGGASATTVAPGDEGLGIKVLNGRVLDFKGPLPERGAAVP